MMTALFGNALRDYKQDTTTGRHGGPGWPLAIAMLLYLAGLTLQVIA